MAAGPVGSSCAGQRRWCSAARPATGRWLRAGSDRHRVRPRLLASGAPEQPLAGAGMLAGLDLALTHRPAPARRARRPGASAAARHPGAWMRSWPRCGRSAPPEAARDRSAGSSSRPTRPGSSDRPSSRRARSRRRCSREWYRALPPAEEAVRELVMIRRAVRARCRGRGVARGTAPASTAHVVGALDGLARAVPPRVSRGRTAGGEAPPSTSTVRAVHELASSLVRETPPRAPPRPGIRDLALDARREGRKYAWLSSVSTSPEQMATAPDTGLRVGHRRRPRQPQQANARLGHGVHGQQRVSGPLEVQVDDVTLGPGAHSGRSAARLNRNVP